MKTTPRSGKRPDDAPRGRTTPRSATPQRGEAPGGERTPRSGRQHGQNLHGASKQVAQESDADVEIREFLEGLLEGFRAAAAANAAQGNTGPRQPKWFEMEGNRGGNWSDLNELEKTLPKFTSGVEAYREGLQSQPPAATPASRASPSPARAAGQPFEGAATPKGAGFASDPLSTMMRRHALRSFLEEMCGSVAKAFEQMAALAVKSSLGSQGGVGLPEQRMKYKFSPMQFQKILSHMGYGVGAGPEWWRALFKSLDVDEDGAVSLQDMYDALVLDLPPLQGQGTDSVFFSSGAQGPSPTRTISPSAAKRGYSPGSPPVYSTMETNSPYVGQTMLGASGDSCELCGTEFTKSTIFCPSCGKRRT